MHLISPMCASWFVRRATHPSRRNCLYRMWRFLGCFNYNVCKFQIGIVFLHIVGLCWEYYFIGPNNNPLAKVNERHMNRGCGKLLLAAAEEHSHRCLAAVTCVADLFPTHIGTKTFKCWATATWNHMKSWCSCFLDPVPSTKGARCRDDRWNL